MTDKIGKIEQLTTTSNAAISEHEFGKGCEKFLKEQSLKEQILEAAIARYKAENAIAVYLTKDTPCSYDKLDTERNKAGRNLNQLIEQYLETVKGDNP